MKSLLCASTITGIFLNCPNETVNPTKRTKMPTHCAQGHPQNGQIDRPTDRLTNRPTDQRPALDIPTLDMLMGVVRAHREAGVWIAPPLLSGALRSGWEGVTTRRAGGNDVHGAERLSEEGRDLHN